MPWFGLQHLCIDRTNGETHRGATCELLDLLYKEVGTKNNKRTVRTQFYDHAGFPMIQNTKFKGKKYCGKKMPIPKSPSQADLYYNFLNVELADKVGFGCNYGLKRCSTSLCMPDSMDCPITEVVLNADESRNLTSVEFGTDKLMFSSLETLLPLTNI
jgi:hypothetical protein